MRLITWDGVLPVAIWCTPFLVGWLFPNRRGAIELTAVLLSVVAFVVRYQVGRHHIASNGCRAAVRRVQMCLLCFGLSALALIDAVMILTHVMPQGAAFAATADLIVWAGLYAVYLTAMTLALHPGRRELPRQRATPTREFVRES